MPRTPEQYEEIRNEKKRMIMNVALELFANEGYHTTSISRIAERANISKGLLYNYFESKEELLRSIMNSLTTEVIDMIDPDHNNEVTQEEALRFFDNYFDMLKNRREQMKLYYQLSVQPQVVGFLLSEQLSSTAVSVQKLLFDYFLQKSQIDPAIGMFHISSVIKGFSLQYVFAPEMFPDEVVEKYKQYLKNEFVLKNK
jgi:AcrR family transcriptional regulator